MKLDRYNNIFFLGIGGIGMSAIALHFHSLGKKVTGYDRTPSDITKRIQETGIEVGFEDVAESLPADTDLVVYTPAVPRNSNLFRFIEEKKIPFVKRGEVLGELVKSNRTIAVAGTHGKTTISCLIAHILKTAGVKITAFIGGICTNYNTNYINDPNSQWAIVEADEFDRSFLHIEPDIALISSLDADHLDIYGTREAMVESFYKFAQGIRPNGTLVVKKGIEKIVGFARNYKSYNLSGPANLYTTSILVENGMQKAAIGGDFASDHFAIGLPGNHNLENALGAALVAHTIGVDPQTIAKGISSFQGVKRRFEKCFENHNTTYIDDYAHHPEEIRACLEACRRLFPEKRITAIFQPHLFSRTRDQAKGFASALAIADQIILMEIYPARELPIPGITSKWLFDQINSENKFLASRNEMLEMVSNQNHELLLTLGAGDIDRSVPEIIEILKSKQS